MYDAGRQREFPIGQVHNSRLYIYRMDIIVDEMQAKMQLRNDRYEDCANIVSAVGCPSCASLKGTPCITAGGHVLGGYVHAARRKAAQS